jgi:uncharacterized protein YbbC (DUF1343 family)
MLDLIDVLIVDLQDIGARTYTYVSTALHAMRASVDAGIPVVILDRPDPIGGRLVQGPTLDPAFGSFVGMLPVPLRHGMTIGELALLGNSVLGIGANLTVVPVAGWLRDTWFDGTGLPWIRPSPNMPDLESASHFPGIVLFEATNLSVGRGTPIAFQVLGAPWIDPLLLMEQLRSEPGVAVRDTTFTPRAPADHKYADTLLPALRFSVTDRALYDPTRFAIRIFAALRDVYPDSLRLTDGLERLYGSDALRAWIHSGETAEVLIQSWEATLEEFCRIREPYLLYR